MPQHPFRTSRIDLFKWGPLDRPPLTPTDERALKRVGHDKGAWYEINWFIRLAQIDIEASEGDVVSLQEDFAALQKVYLRHANPPPPPCQQIVELQRTVRKHLEELANQGWTLLPEVPVQQVLIYPHMQAKLATLAEGKVVETPSTFPDCESHHVTPPRLSSLISVMGQLLEKVGKLIVRCPHCESIFLQSRRNQEYCGRGCQSVAVMQRRRAEAKTRNDARAAKKRERKGGGMGGPRRGTKKR
jgi:hypothetical protein